MFKTVINSEDERLRDFIQRLPEIFDHSSDVVYEGRRNILKKFTVDGQVVNAGGCSTITPVDVPAALATPYLICTGSVGTCRAVM